MDTRTGEINTLSNFNVRFSEDDVARFIRPVELDDLPSRARRQFSETGSARIGRNDPCPCGSGKKFKKCCKR